jgi:4-hydroxythreonine-4-phosphate dehydrogenase
VNGVRRLVISMGDPTGIGPEVTLKAIAQWRSAPMPILVGDLGVYRDTQRRLGLSLPLAPWQPGARSPARSVPVFEISNLRFAARRPGHPNLSGGKAAHRAILAAVRLIGEGHAEALVTAPISKANLVAAGVATTGHTELLAELTGSRSVRMMMIGDRLRVVLVTTHLALAQVPKALSTPRVYETIAMGASALQQHLGITAPRVGVAGLNPHAGEGGLFGSEDRRIIRPAVQRARRRGIDAVGPLAADSLFPHAAAGLFDLVVCMYHDQGLAPFKLMHFSDGVNFTTGLPFVRTSPDHGTAYDIAGGNRADAGSMVAAMRLAAQPRRVRRAA